MKVVKGVANFIIALSLSLLILANFVLFLVSHTVLEKEYMISLLEKNSYYEKIETDLINGFEEYQYQSGLPAEVFKDLYTEEMVKVDVLAMLNGIYEGKEVVNSSEEVKNRVIENINRYLSENSIVLTEKSQKNIDTFQTLIVKTYEDKVKAPNELIKNIAQWKDKIETIVKIAKIGTVITLMVGLILALVVNRNTYVISISMLSSGILLKLVPWVIQRNIDIDHILLLTQTLSDFIKDIIYDLLGKFNDYGFLFILMGIIGMIFSSYNTIKRKEL